MKKLGLIKERGKSLMERSKGAVSNERGDIKSAGKIVIACIGLVAILGITVFLLNWGKGKVEDTTRQIDTEYQNWSN